VEGGDGDAEFVGDGIFESGGEEHAHRGQIPEGAVSASFETCPSGRAVAANIGEEGAGVVELVGGDDEKHGG
jgi:hypothetical protein